MPEDPGTKSSLSCKPLEETTKLALSAAAQESGMRTVDTTPSGFAFGFAGLGQAKSPKRLVVIALTCPAVIFFRFTIPLSFP